MTWKERLCFLFKISFVSQIKPQSRLLPNWGGGPTVHLSIQDDFVLLQLQDDLVDATDHSVNSLRQTLARLGLLQRLLLAGLGQLLLDLLQVLKTNTRLQPTVRLYDVQPTDLSVAKS